jgi:hypothetical protein
LEDESRELSLDLPGEPLQLVRYTHPEPDPERPLLFDAERILRPLVEAEERRAGTRLVRAGKEIAALDKVGLRAMNEALRSALDAPWQAGFARGGAASELKDPGFLGGSDARLCPGGRRCSTDGSPEEVPR